MPFGGTSTLGSWHSPDPRARQWHRGKHRRRRYTSNRLLRYSTIALAAVLLFTLAWRGIGWTKHSYGAGQAGTSASYSPVPAAPGAEDPRASGWQREFNDALESAAQDVSSGQIGAGEVAVDRADTILTTERLISASAKPDFFVPALTALDGLLAKRPGDSRLFEHVTLARISLAEFQSSLLPEPPQPSVAKRIAIGVPREIAAGEKLDSASFGGQILDATLMPDTAEVLLPPSSRAFTDNVRVENLMIEGAAQTLDGIRWRDVTFVGTRIRYESGELDLQDVQFVRCRFGFTTDERGARLATALAQGNTTIAIP
jgi:hypothetical protein